MDAGAYVSEGLTQVATPANLRALLHRLGHLDGCGQSALAGVADDSERGVERHRRVGKVKDSFLNASSRRLQAGMNRVGDTVGTVN